jgi:hypothetical protein
VSNRFPLRLIREEITGSMVAVKDFETRQAADSVPGVLCGSSFLNEKFEALLKARLSHDDFIGGSDPLEKITERAVTKFENHLKRDINTFDLDRCRKSVEIPGLIGHPKKRFSHGRLHISK